MKVANAGTKYVTLIGVPAYWLILPVHHCVHEMDANRIHFHDFPLQSELWYEGLGPRKRGLGRAQELDSNCPRCRYVGIVIRHAKVGLHPTSIAMVYCVKRVSEGI